MPSGLLVANCYFSGIVLLSAYEVLG